MKKTLTIITLLAGAVGVYSQGTINFQDYTASFCITIWSPQTDNPGFQQTGQGANDIPAGATVYSGVPIGGAATGTAPYFYADGNDYTVALWAAAGLNVALAPANQLATATMSNHGGTGVANIVDNASGLGSAGSWAGSQTVTVPGSIGGSTGTASVQLAAWFNAGGTITSYAAALAAGDPNGLSPSANLTGLGGAPNSTTIPATPVDLPSGPVGLQSFSLTTFPEPSTIALGVIGASAFLMRLRRK